MSVNHREARVVIEDLRRRFNEERPHSSLGYRTPREFAKSGSQDSAPLRRTHPIHSLNLQQSLTLGTNDHMGVWRQLLFPTALTQVTLRAARK